MKSEPNSIKKYIMSRCVQTKEERNLIPQVTRRFNISNSIVRNCIRELKNEGQLFVPKKNMLRVIV